jgi:FkbM family methyltransferase
MCENLSKHDWKNVTILNLAVSDKRGESEFTVFVGNSGYSGLMTRLDVPGSFTLKNIKVDTSTIDEILLGDEKRVCLIKLDIEGGEYHAILGGFGIISRDRPIVLFENGLKETSELYGYSENSFFSLFLELKYRVFNCFGQEISSFNPNTSGATAWQFIAFPKEMSPALIRYRICISMIKALISVIKEETLEEFEMRLIK